MVNLVAEAEDLTLDSGVFGILRSWKTRDCLPLWIEGPFDAEEPSTNTLIAASLAYTTRQSGIPVAFHFCGNAPFKSQREYCVSQLLELTYSLIAQLATQLSHSAQPKWQLREDQFKSLHHSPESLTGAITLLGELLQHRPQPLVVIIDGLETAEELGNRVQEGHLTKLLEALCSPSEADEGGKYKMCFTTAGNVNALAGLVVEQKVQIVSFEQPQPDELDDEQRMDGLVIEP